jgi:predicted transcriptional regulator
MKTKRQKVLEFIIENEGATIPEICEQFFCSEANARQMIAYLRKDGNLITTHAHGNSKCSYTVVSKAAPKEESTMENLRTILSTGDEWTCQEIAEMIGRTTKQVSNAIGFIRRGEGWNIKTKQIGHHEFSYQLEVM